MIRAVLALLLLLATPGLPRMGTAAQDLPYGDPPPVLGAAQVEETLREVADWQLAHPAPYPVARRAEHLADSAPDLSRDEP